MSASGPVNVQGSRPAAAGLHLDENHDGAIYGTTLPLIVVASIAVILRIAVRLMRGRPKIECDDLFCAVALVWTIGTAICCYIAIPYGVGRHQLLLTPSDVVIVWKCMYSQMILYATSVTFAKISALLFYRRLFDFTWLFWAGLFLVLSYWLTAIIAINVACRPTHYLWDRYAEDPGNGFCDFSVLDFFFANGIWAMIIDAIILCMPIPCCLKLQMPPSERAVVIGILLVGGGVCITSVMRIIALANELHTPDVTYAAGPVFMWSTLEPSMAIICACLPTFAPFLRVWYWSLCAKASTVRSPPCPLAQQRGEGGGPGECAGFSGPVTNNNDQQSDALSQKRDRDRQAFRASMHRRAWGPLDGIDDLANLTYHGRLRDDDEVELTTTISGPVTGGFNPGGHAGGATGGFDFGASVEGKEGIHTGIVPHRNDVICVERGVVWHASPIEEKEEIEWETMEGRLNK